MRRTLKTALIAVLVIYAPIELTRLIVAYGLKPELIFEIVCIWALYLVAILIVYKLTKGR